jgi:hypothetical protein
MKITHAVWKLLPSDVQASFTKIGTGADDASEFDNGEENAAGLKTALDKEKEATRKAAQERDALKADEAKKLEEARKQAVEEARTKGDFKTVEDDYKKRIKDLEDANKRSAKEAEDRLKGDAINQQVDDIAKLFTSPALAKAFIKGRLSAEIVDGAAIVRVLSKDGKASASSVEDLKKEYLTDSDLKGSLVASKGSGGGSTRSPSGGGSTVEGDKFDAANADPKSMIARLESKGIDDGGDDD